LFYLNLSVSIEVADPVLSGSGFFDEYFEPYLYLSDPSYRSATMFSLLDYFSSLSLSFSANEADCFLEQVVKTKPPNSFFVSTIGDFAQDQTVFSKSTATHWKPVMLISQERVTS
jgi:hypothetical protein